MIVLLRLFMRTVELLFAVPLRVLRFITVAIAFNPRLGPLRYLAIAALCYVAFAVTLVYAVAPIRGLIGVQFQSEKLRYDSRRWLATAIYDVNNDFVGTYDPRLDSVRDVNFTGEAIEIGDYIANPDHKSIPVKDVPPQYWRCLVYHEDRHLGSFLNPFGIDLLGVLKIPYSSIRRSIRAGRIRFGVGGSTLPMQLARVIYKSPPNVSESAPEKLARKFSEWWLAPVIYRELTRGGHDAALKQWAANHLWLAQRTGGPPLHGVEITARIVFGKQAHELSTAEQFILASAVNKPIILLEGSERLNEVRLDRWRYITEVRARKCAEALIKDPKQQSKILFELVNIAGGPPDPQIRASLRQPLEKYAPKIADRARANPMIRANVLMPSARFGMREEMKQLFGFNWRNHVRGINTTLDVGDNLAFHTRIRADLKRIDKRWRERLNPGYTLDPDIARTDNDRQMPNVIVVAADQQGRIVRYYENSELAPYFGSLSARNQETGRFTHAKEPRQIASTGKMLAAIAIANAGRDTLQTTYVDRQAPKRGLETCDRRGTLRRGRKSIVAFACSLNGPIEWRTAMLGQRRMARLIEGFAFNMPPAPSPQLQTPPSTAAVRGLIAGSPRRVHQMSAAILAALIGKGDTPVPEPTLVAKYDFTSPKNRARFRSRKQHRIIPSKLISRSAHTILKAYLQAPLCYRANRRSYGTMKSLQDWCARRRGNLRFHIAKTGTSVTRDANATVDGLVTGALQFANGAAYSYVVVVGTGSASNPFGNRLHAAQLALPLLRTLLNDLQDHARDNAVVVAHRSTAKRRTKRRPSQRKVVRQRKKRQFTIEQILEQHLRNNR